MSPSVERQFLPDAVNRLAVNFTSVAKLATLPTPEQLGFTWTGNLTPSQNQAFSSLWNLKILHPNEYWSGLRRLAVENRFIVDCRSDQETAENYIRMTKQHTRSLVKTYREKVEVPAFQTELYRQIDKNSDLSRLSSQQKIQLVYII